MAQEAMPVREARLGRAIGQEPGPGHAVGGVVLLLPAGDEHSTRRVRPLALAQTRALGRRLARAGRAEGLVAHVVHYRGRGWNGAEARLAADAVWAADEVVRRYGDVPVCLAGIDMGGRAALRSGGHTAVNSVLALAPWLPEGGARAGAGAGAGAGSGVGEPVKQLVGRRVLVVHGTNDERTDPELSFRFAERVKKVNRDTARFEVHSDGHALVQHRAEVFALAADFVTGALFGRPFARPVADAFAAPPPLGLRMPLASGFGRAPLR